MEITSGLFALGGALIGGMITVVAQAIAQRSESRRNFQRLVFEAATAEWTKRYEAFTRMNEKKGDQYNFVPVTDFLLEYSFWARMNQSLWESNFNEATVAENIRKIGKFSASIRDARLVVEGHRIATIENNLKKTAKN